MVQPDAGRGVPVTVEGRIAPEGEVEVEVFVVSIKTLKLSISVNTIRAVSADRR
jgi:hypothetical protein